MCVCVYVYIIILLVLRKVICIWCGNRDVIEVGYFFVGFFFDVDVFFCFKMWVKCGGWISYIEWDVVVFCCYG